MLGTRSLQEVCAGEVVADRYEVIAPLGRGGFGAVYTCRDRVVGSAQVAVKLIPNAVMRGARYKRRVAREIQAANRICHDNVVRIYDVHICQDYIAIVTELIRGKTLSDLLAMHGKLEPLFVADILRQIFLGLSAIHAQGVLHRDLKLDNILYSADGVVKIADFGIASLNPPPSETAAKTEEGIQNGQKSTDSATIVGTVEYISPEAIQGAKVDIRSDIYAVGVVAYRLTTSMHLFAACHVAELFERKVKKDPVAPHQCSASCPKSLSTFVMRVLSRNPDERYQSTAECLDALKDIAESSDLACHENARSLIQKRWEAAGAPPQDQLQGTVYELVSRVLEFVRSFLPLPRSVFDASRTQNRVQFKTHGGLGAFFKVIFASSLLKALTIGLIILGVALSLPTWFNSEGISAPLDLKWEGYRHYHTPNKSKSKVIRSVEDLKASSHR